jgi:hypothetical protein
LAEAVPDAHLPDLTAVTEQRRSLLARVGIVNAPLPRRGGPERSVGIRSRLTSDPVPLYAPRDAVLLRALCQLEQCQSVAECQLGNRNGAACARSLTCFRPCTLTTS